MSDKQEFNMNDVPGTFVQQKEFNTAANFSQMQRERVEGQGRGGRS